jgi:hypothetical protein
MKNKTLAGLLKSIELSKESNENNIINLSDMLLSKMLKGGYETKNHYCAMTVNASCQNNVCPNSMNNSCSNSFCDNGV